MKKFAAIIPNISCAHCAHTIKSEVGELRGVKKIDVDVQGKKISVEYEDPATEGAIAGKLAEINYPPAQ